MTDFGRWCAHWRASRSPDRDQDVFSVWITSSHLKNDLICRNYTTRLQRNSERQRSTLLGFWEACKSGNEWTSHVAPFIQEVIGKQGGGPQHLRSGGVGASIRPAKQIVACLKLNKQSLSRDELTPRQVLNRCFLIGELSERAFSSAVDGTVELAKEVGLTREDAYAILDIPYDWYTHDEIIAAPAVFSALSAFGPTDAYI